MTTYNGQVMSVVPAMSVVNPNIAVSGTPAEAPKYRNRVWDTQKAGSDKSHYWVTDTQPDVDGLFYDGPGTWGTHTSDHSAVLVKPEGDITPQVLTESNLWAPPETPHAQDDEFDQSTLGSEWYNWSGPSAAFGTLSYDTVDVYDSSFTAGDALRITVNPDTRRSWALLQPPNDRWMFLGKALTVPTNVLVMARLKFLHFYNTSTTNFDRNIALWFMADSSGNPDPNNRVNMYLNDINSNTIRSIFFKTSGGVDTDLQGTTNTQQQGQALEYVAIQKLGTTYHGWVGTAAGNWIWLGSFTQSTTMAHVGVFMSNATVDKPAVGCFGVDFIRFKETTNFLF